VEAILYYLAAYGAMTIGAFAVIAYLDSPRAPWKTSTTSRGKPDASAGGAGDDGVPVQLDRIPLTAGFTGKF